jgi:CRISPR/Cas system CMR-associated protein Cmr3 (group 5 of RAMP superfamily)
MNNRDIEMTEQDLIKLGFKKKYVTSHESGYDKDWFYYTYDFTKYLSLVSNDNFDAETKGWYVEFLGGEGVKFTAFTELEQLINIIEKAEKYD